MSTPGRAFARFQDGIQWFAGDRAKAREDVRSLAERAYELDPLDPFANMAMGRWHWMAGRPDDGLDWYDRAIQLSPSYSKGHYTRGMVDAFAGRSERARSGLDVALRRLVPEITVTMYLQSLPMSSEDVHARKRQAMHRLGIPVAG